jgi:hypothetical protein
MCLYENIMLSIYSNQPRYVSMVYLALNYKTLPNHRAFTSKDLKIQLDVYDDKQKKEKERYKGEM